jgi:hypothetical protein
LIACFNLLNFTVAWMCAYESPVARCPSFLKFCLISMCSWAPSSLALITAIRIAQVSMTFLDNILFETVFIFNLLLSSLFVLPSTSVVPDVAVFSSKYFQKVQVFALNVAMLTLVFSRSHS